VDLTLTVFAWLGTIAILAAYFLVSYEKVSSTGFWYQAMNIFAGVSLTAYGVLRRTWPTVALNSAWLLIGLAALLGARRRAAAPIHEA